MGKTSAPVSMARRNAPSLKLCISPVLERVPSGKIITGTPCSSQSAHLSSAALAAEGDARSMGTSFTRRMLQPMNGRLKSERLASHFISQGKCEIKNTSVCEQWLLTHTVLPGFLGTSPWTRKRHIGERVAADCATRRKVRPLRMRFLSNQKVGKYTMTTATQPS